MKLRNPFRLREQGQSMLEFAVSLVILLVLLAGAVDLGRIIFYYLSMRDAAQEGLTYGSVFPAYCDQIEDRILSSLTDIYAVDVDVTIGGVACKAVPTTDLCVNEEMIVTVTHPDFPISMPFIGTFIGQTITLRAEVTGTVLRRCR